MTDAFFLWLYALSGYDLALLYGGGVVFFAIVLSFMDDGAEPVALFWPVLVPILCLVAVGAAVLLGPKWLFKNGKKHFAFPFHWIMIRYYKWKYNAKS